MSSAHRTPSLFRRVAARAIIGAVVAMMVVAVFGYWRFLNARSTSAEPTAEVNAINAAPTPAEKEERRLELNAKISVMTERVAESEKQIQQMEELQKSWNLVSQNEVRKRAAAERLEAAQRLHAEDVAELAALKQELASATQNPGSRLENSSGEAPSHGEGLWPYLWRSWVLLWVWLGVGIVLYAAGPLLWVAKRSQDSTSLDVGSRAPMP